MILYRIGNCNYINDLSGNGARIYGGRWNSVGKPMLYLASSRSLAVLEVLVHISPTQMVSDACMVEIDVPDESIAEIDAQILPEGWQDPSPPIILQKLGDLFLSNKNFLLMKVPSAVVKQEHNYLLNPLHPLAASVKIIKTEPFSFDNRLF